MNVSFGKRRNGDLMTEAKSFSNVVHMYNTSIRQMTEKTKPNFPSGGRFRSLGFVDRRWGKDKHLVENFASVQLDHIKGKWVGREAKR